MKALLIGREPAAELGYAYVREGPWDAVVIGSLTLGELIRFREERVLTALAEGKSVYLYTPGLPAAEKNRALAGAIASAQHGGGGPGTAAQGPRPRSGGGADAPGEGNFGRNGMKIGKVVGSVWATRKAGCLAGHTFLVVDTGKEDLVAADQVGAGVGDRVLLATGTVASRYCMEAPIDAAIIAILDGEKA